MKKSVQWMLTLGTSWSSHLADINMGPNNKYKLQHPNEGNKTESDLRATNLPEVYTSRLLSKLHSAITGLYYSSLRSFYSLASQWEVFNYGKFLNFCD